MSPNHLPLSATLKIMVLSYSDHLSNNILWAEMVIVQNGYGPKWSWTELVMTRNDPEPSYNMSHDVRKQRREANQPFLFASLVKICPLVQKIMPGNEISYITKGRCDLEN